MHPENKDRTVTITRVLKAPIALVWEAMTEPKHLVHWYHADEDWTTPFAEMDMKVGGKIRIGFGSPDGKNDFVFTGTFTEVTPPKFMAYAIDDGRAVTTRLTELGPKQTKLEVTFALETTFSEEQQRDGWTKMYVHLDQYLATLAQEHAMYDLKTEAPVGEPIIIQTRAFNAPRALVWEAMTRPEHIARWWGPHEMKTTVERLDVRPGGGWRFVHTAPDGRSIVFHGEYRDVQPPKCIVQTFGVEGMYDGRFIVETMTLEEDGDKTHYRVISHFESLADRDGMIASGMEKGARESLERLDAIIAELKQAQRRTA